MFDVVEFQNVYGLSTVLDVSREFGRDLRDYDFERAKLAFFNEVSMDRLMKM